MLFQALPLHSLTVGMWCVVCNRYKNGYWAQIFWSHKFKLTPFVVKWYDFQFNSTHYSLWKTVSRGMWSCWANLYSRNFYLHSKLQDKVCSGQVELFQFSVKADLWPFTVFTFKYNSNGQYKISYQKKKIVKLHKLLLRHFYVKNPMMTNKSQNIKRLL